MGGPWLIPAGRAAAVAPPAAYQIARSLRFNSPNGSKLSIASPPARTSNAKCTTSFWIKRALRLSATWSTIFGGYDGSSSASAAIAFDGSDKLVIASGGPNTNLVSVAAFRDYSAPMHVVVVHDGATSPFMFAYVNNALQALSGSAQSATHSFMSPNANNRIGNIYGDVLGGYFLDGYLADFHFIDGQALTPADFGQIDPTTGVWVPKAYAGTYGAAGFHLDFADNSNITAATLGKDRSGNNVDWTPAGISVTAGIANDSLLDTPTNYGGPDTGVGGEIRGNYPTWSPSSNLGGMSLNYCDLAVTGIAAWRGIRATVGLPTTGKWYWEYQTVALDNVDRHAYGVCTSGDAPSFHSNIPGSEPTTWECRFGGVADTGYANNGAFTQLADATPWGVNSIVQVAIDMDAGKIWFGLNNVWMASGNPTAGTNPVVTGLPKTLMPCATMFGTGNSNHVNFGQRPFAFAAPSGFKAICTQNLPAPAIVKPSQHMDVNTRVGTAAAFNVTGKGFKPDLVWPKGRSGATSHVIANSLRGVGKYFSSDVTGSAEVSDAQSITAFNADGFSGGTAANLNTNLATYVDWLWKAGGAGVSNTAGSITSTVSANPTAGISVVTYTGNGANATIGHGLGVVPALIIAKNLNGGGNLTIVGHQNQAATPWVGFLDLGSTAAYAANAAIWNTAATSAVFGQGAAVGTNINGNSMVALCFAEVPGFSKFGSFSGNSATDGVFVWCGFRPRWILLKRVDAVTSWVILDTSRDTINPAQTILNPNTAAADASFASLDILSNGFKLRTADAGLNAGTMIYAAFAETPFNYARAR